MHCCSTLAQVSGLCVNFRGHDTFHLTLEFKLGVLQERGAQDTSQPASFTESFTLDVPVSPKCYFSAYILYGWVYFNIFLNTAVNE